MTMRRGLSHIGWTVLVVLSAAVLGRGVAMADQVTSKGTVLHGKVTGIGSSGITFEPEYGKGALTIDWKDVEDVHTDDPFQTFHDDEELIGALQGVSDGRLLIGDSRQTAKAIDFKSIFLGVRIGPGGLTFLDRMRSVGRYWDGTFDFGFNLQDATTDSKGVAFAFQTVRTKGPTLLTLGASYRYSTQTTKERLPDPTVPGKFFTDHQTQQIENEAIGLLRFDYLFTPRFYAFGSADGTYDGIQHLSIRAVPKAGVGYVIWDRPLQGTDHDFLKAEVGGGWVYEKFFGGDDDDFFTIVFGALANYHLPYGALFTWKFDFLPAVDDFTGDYLMRTEAGLGVPIVGPVSAKFTVRDEYDSTPAKNTDKNALYLTLGLSVAW
jgi:hypothetical protein